MNNIEYIHKKLQELYPNKKIVLSEPIDKFNGSYWLNIDHVCISWFANKPHVFGMAADFDPEPLYTNQVDLIDNVSNLDSYLDKVCGFINNKLITVAPYAITPEVHRARLDNEK